MSESSTPTEKPKSRTPLVVLAGVLGCLGIACVSILLSLFFLNRTGVLTVGLNLGSTATPTLTFTPIPTATPLFTPTPVATSTPLATDTPSATPTVEPPSGGGPTDIPPAFVAFDSEFEDDCPLFEGTNETRDYFCELGEYVMHHFEATTRYSYLDRAYTDGIVETEGFFYDGTGKYEYGLVFRANADGTRYYVFTVTNDGKYVVSLYDNNEYTDLIPYTASPLVDDLLANRLRVVMRGSRFDFYLNDEYIGNVEDSTLPDGLVGLFFYNGDPDGEVGFDYLAISTFTMPTATPVVSATPEATATPSGGAVVPPNVAPGVYVTGLRMAPGAPKYRQDITFFPTFLNTTGRPTTLNWSVELFFTDTNQQNSLGITDGANRNIPTGTRELATSGNYRLTGGGPCRGLRARVIFENDQSQRVPIQRPNGADLWFPFQVCP